MDLSGLDRIKDASSAVAAAIEAACLEYANGGFRARPIVYSHFTRGNQSRYGWAPLSPRYARRKARQTKGLRKGMKAAGKSVPAGAGLPMLVRTGALRDAITGGGATVRRTAPEAFVIEWANDPHYATYLHNGTPKMPKRSPIEPNADDERQVIDAARRYLSAAVGTGGGVAIGGAPGARARVA